MSVVKEAVAQTDGNYDATGGLLTITGDQMAVFVCPEKWTTMTVGYTHFWDDPATEGMKEDKEFTLNYGDKQRTFWATDNNIWTWKEGYDFWLKSRTEKAPPVEDKKDEAVLPKDEYWVGGWKLDPVKWVWDITIRRSYEDTVAWTKDNYPKEATVIGVLHVVEWDAWTDQKVAWQKELTVEGQPESTPEQNVVPPVLPTMPTMPGPPAPPEILPADMQEVWDKYWPWVLCAVSIAIGTVILYWYFFLRRGQ